MEPIELASALAHAPTKLQAELASRISAIRADWWKRNSHLPPSEVRPAWSESPEHAEVLRLLEEGAREAFAHGSREAMYFPRAIGPRAASNLAHSAGSMETEAVTRRSFAGFSLRPAPSRAPPLLTRPSLGFAFIVSASGTTCNNSQRGNALGTDARCRQ